MAKWEFEIKPLDDCEVHYPEKMISFFETGVPKKYISQQIEVCTSVIKSMLPSANIQQRIVAWWPCTSGAPTWAFALGATIALRDCSQAIHGWTTLEPIILKSLEMTTMDGLQTLLESS